MMRVALSSTCGLAILLVVGVAFLTRSPFNSDAIAALAVLSLAALAATNFDITTRDGVGMSGNVMILVASLVIFHDYDLFLGPVVVGACGAIDIAQARAGAWNKIAFNAATDSLALLAGAGVFWLVAGSTASTGLLLFASACATTAYLGINSAVVSVPVALSVGESYVNTLRQVASFNLSAYPFGLVGLGLGWAYLSLGAIAIPLLVVPILIARRSFASYLELRDAQEQTIATLILALEAKDRYTAGHAQRVAQFASYIGSELGFGPRRMERLRYAALMHDIGKLVVPNQLLNKPGRLTEAEFERVRRHEPVSVELLRRIDFLAPVAGDTTTEAATAAVDGSGLIEPAIIHVADAFDAMTSTRSYRRALPQDVAFGELRKGAGKQFNAECANALIAAIEKRGEQHGAGFEAEQHEWAVAPPEAGTGSAGLGHLLPDQRAVGR
jgi:hypothetical protein